MPTMKTLKRLSHLLLFGACITLARAAYAAPSLLDGTIFSDPTLAYSTAPAFDVSRIESISMQATASSAPATALSVDDGRKSTGTITFVSTQSLTNLRIGVNGCSFTNGQEFSTVSTSSGNASALRTALAASTCLSGVVTSSWTGGTSAVVSLTASTIGTAGNSIALFSSVPSSVTLSGATMSNGDDSNFSITTEKVTTAAAHGISTGLPLLFAKVTGTVPTGLTDATTYYAIVTSPMDFKLALTSTGSLAGSAIDITAITGAGTFTLTPTAFAGTWSWKWQGSNDGLNWADLSAAGVTYSVPVTTLWDGLVHYKFLRFAFTAGTGGGMNIKVVGYGQGRE